MTDRNGRHNDHRSSTTTEDEASSTQPRTISHLPNRPFVLGFLAVALAAVLFLFGIRVGEAVYLAFDGDDAMAAIFGGTFIAILVIIITLGVILDRRRRARDTKAGPLTDAQRERCRSNTADLFKDVSTQDRTSTSRGDGSQY